MLKFNKLLRKKYMVEGSIGGSPTPAQDKPGQISAVQDTSPTPRAQEDRRSLASAPEKRAASPSDTVLAEVTRNLKMASNARNELSYQVWDEDEGGHTGGNLSVESYVRTLRDSLKGSSAAELQQQADERTKAALMASRPKSGVPTESAYRLAVEADTLNQLAAEIRAETAGNPEPTPTITLPEDPEVVAQLELKLAEYRTRLATAEKGLVASKSIQEGADLKKTINDSRAKIMVLQRLLERGGISSFEMSVEVENELGIPGDEAHSAVRVIRGYIEGGNLGGGREIVGGTGLPELPNVSADLMPSVETPTSHIDDLQAQRLDLLQFFGQDASNTEAAPVGSREWNQVVDAMYNAEEARLKKLGITGEELEDELEKFDDSLEAKGVLLKSIEARIQEAGSELATQLDAPDASIDPPAPVVPEPTPSEPRHAEIPGVPLSVNEPNATTTSDDIDNFFDTAPEEVDLELDRARAEILPADPNAVDEPGQLPTAARMKSFQRDRSYQTATGFGGVKTVDTPRPLGLSDRTIPQRPTADTETNRPTGPVITDDDIARRTRERLDAQEQAELDRARAEILPADPNAANEAEPTLPTTARLRGFRGRRPDVVQARGFGQTTRVEAPVSTFLERTAPPSESDYEGATGAVITDDDIALERAQQEIQPTGGLETLQARYDELQASMEKLLQQEDELMKGYGRLEKFLISKLGRTPAELRDVRTQMEETMTIMKDMSGLIADMRREASTQLRPETEVIKDYLASESGSGQKALLAGELEARSGNETISMMEDEREDILAFFGLDKDPDTMENASVYGPKLAAKMNQMGDKFEDQLRKEAGLRPTDPLPEDVEAEITQYDNMLVQRFNRLTELEHKIQDAELARRPAPPSLAEIAQLDEEREERNRRSNIAAAHARSRRDNKSKVSVLGASYDV